MQLKKIKNLISGLVVIILTILFGFGCSRFGTNTNSGNAAVNKTISTNSTVNNSNSTNSPSSLDSKPTLNGGDLAGEYSVSGTYPNGKGYANDLTVIKRGDAYEFKWTSSGKTISGVGVQGGDLVAVGLDGGTDAKGCGAVVFKINGNKLEGKYGIWGSTSLHTQTATLVSQTKTSGVFDLQLTDTSGTYKFNLTIEPGEIYQLNYRSGNRWMGGTGYRQGEYLAAGIGQKQCSYTVYTVSNGNLKGIWGKIGEAQHGTETATRK